MIRPVPSHLAYFSAHFGAAPADDYLTKVTLDTMKEGRSAQGQSWFPGMPVKTVAMAAVAARAAYLEAAKEASEPNLQKDPNALKGPFTKLADSAAYDYNRPENTVSGVLNDVITKISPTAPRTAAMVKSWLEQANTFVIYITTPIPTFSKFADVSSKYGTPLTPGPFNAVETRKNGEDTWVHLTSSTGNRMTDGPWIVASSGGQTYATTQPPPILAPAPPALQPVAQPTALTTQADPNAPAAGTTAAGTTAAGAKSPGKMPGWVLPAAAVAGAAGLALILFPNLLGGAPQSAPNRYDR